MLYSSRLQDENSQYRELTIPKVNFHCYLLSVFGFEGIKLAIKLGNKLAIKLAIKLANKLVIKQART